MAAITSLAPSAAFDDLRGHRSQPDLGRVSTVLGHLAAGLAAAPALWLLPGQPSLLLSVGLVAGWVVAQGTTRTLTAVAGAPASTGPILRGGMAMGLACWVVDALAPVPAPPGVLLAFVATATAGSLAVQGLRSLRRGRHPVRTLVVADDDDALGALVRLGGAPGRLAPVRACLPEQLAGTLEEVRPDAVLVLPSPRISGRILQRIEWQLEGSGIPLLVSTGLMDVVPGRARVIRSGSLGVLELCPAPRRGAQQWAKNVWERAAALSAILLLLPVLVGLAVVISLDSAGPVFFRQLRVGKDGRRFTMWKFRTMRTDAERVKAALAAENECDGVMFKMRRDPRITRVGAVLRRYSLDELPQLLNVVRGDMALVGPRPALPEEVARYDADPVRRLVVKPGITGLWQVSGRSDLTWEESVRLDLAYVDNWSLRLDVAILWRTVGAVLGQRGAY